MTTTSEAPLVASASRVGTALIISTAPAAETSSTDASVALEGSSHQRVISEKAIGVLAAAGVEVRDEGGVSSARSPRVVITCHAHKEISFRSGGEKYSVVQVVQNAAPAISASAVQGFFVFYSYVGAGHRYIIVPRQMWAEIDARLQMQFFKKILFGDVYENTKGLLVFGDRSKPERLYVNDGKGAGGVKGRAIQDGKEVLVAVAFGDFHERGGIDFSRLRHGTADWAREIL